MGAIKLWGRGVSTAAAPPPKCSNFATLLTRTSAPCISAIDHARARPKSLGFPLSHRQLCFRKLAMRHFPSATAISFALAAAVWAAPAAAQDAPVGPAVEDSGLSDIVVTAQRREESLQDVPVSVSVLSGDTLGAITSTGADVRVLAGRVPSLNIESSFGRTFPRFYIRGLGNTDFDLNASQPVSLVYDDVVLENPRSEEHTSELQS